MGLEDIQNDIKAIMIQLQALQCKIDFSTRDDVKLLFKRLRELKVKAETYKRLGNEN